MTFIRPNDVQCRLMALELLDLAAVAQRLGTSESHVRGLVSRREIPHVKLGRFLRFDPEAIETWIKANTRVEAPEVAS